MVIGELDSALCRLVDSSACFFLLRVTDLGSPEGNYKVGSLRQGGWYPLPGDPPIEIKPNARRVALEEDPLLCLLAGFESRIEANAVGLCGGIRRAS